MTLDLFDDDPLPPQPTRRTRQKQAPAVFAPAPPDACGEPAILPPDAALAEGLAQHVELWARAQGAAPEDARAAADAARAVSLAMAQGHVCIRLSALQATRESLLASGVVGTPAAPGACPLLLDDDGRLYLHRAFDDERRLARRLLQAARAGRLSIISGGPGTGKTTRVAQDIAAALQAEPGLRIALAAPTGKAAARMTEALHQRAAGLDPALRALLPRESHTVHRLLGLRPGAGFAHDASHPLAVDLLVVDEASMLDLQMATRLVQALPPSARLVLLGDKDQLAAVESGAVFADLSADRELLPVAWLEKNWRFPADSGIGRLAALVRQGDAAGALDWLRASGDASIRWAADEAPAALARAGYGPFLDAVAARPREVAQAWQAFGRFRVLCALREGPQGVEGINQALTREARQRLGAGAGAGAWYPGRPVMVGVNDYAMRLFNGDIGLTLPDATGQPMVWFPDGEGMRAVPPAHMPRHETAYAMTVHKAQGSEFDEVLLVLPQAEVRVATRELVYTGITRARARATLCADEAALAAAIGRQVLRDGGLQARLREAAAG